jgi:hypothetical protein
VPGLVLELELVPGLELVPMMKKKEQIKKQVLYCQFSLFL